MFSPRTRSPAVTLSRRRQAVRYFPEGFHADRLLRRVPAPPAPGGEPPPLAITPLNPRVVAGLGRPAAEHPARPILLVRLKAHS